MSDDVWATVVAQAWTSYVGGGWGVGAVVVDAHGDVVSAACNTSGDATASLRMLRHAEIAALDAIPPADAATCTIYSSLEPCILCLGALAFYRLGTAVFASRDLSFSPSWTYLRKAPIVRTRVPDQTGPLLDQRGAFCRVVSMVAEVENGVGPGAFGLERRMTPRLVALVERCLATRVFFRRKDDAEGWRDLLTELDPHLESVVPELERVETRLADLGLTERPRD